MCVSKLNSKLKFNFELQSAVEYKFENEKWDSKSIFKCQIICKMQKLKKKNI